MDDISICLIFLVPPGTKGKDKSRVSHQRGTSFKKSPVANVSIYHWQVFVLFLSSHGIGPFMTRSVNSFLLKVFVGGRLGAISQVPQVPAHLHQGVVHRRHVGAVNVV